MNEDKDTNICISPNQAKFLVKQYHQVSELKELNTILNNQLSISDTLLKNKDTIIKNQQSIIINKDSIIGDKDLMIKKYEKIEKRLNRRLKFQKVLTSILFTSTILVTSLYFIEQ